MAEQDPGFPLFPVPPSDCTLCKFYSPLMDAPGKGKCRRHPPIPYPTGVNMTTAVWPIVTMGDW